VIRLVAIVVIALTTLAACGPTKYLVQSTPLATGADADILAEAEKDQNFVRLNIKAHNLPPPDRIKEGLTHFVVWQRENNDKTWVRVAALQYDDGAREGTLAEATVALLKFDLLITAEGAPDVDVPSENVIFTQHIAP
jgi:hypothetical protein